MTAPMAVYGAALRRAEPLGQDQFHPILFRRQNDRGAAQERLPIVQTEGDGEVRDGVVRRENIRAAQHVKSKKFFELAGLDPVGELDRCQDALHPGFLCVLGKRHVL